ncbi:GAF domain-containing sensor histidine kinase [Paenibacillaceae bacterium WGS1546]|uniref:sensor histidine kinase n=1 Tax=Cohnella sp. WGS1546 TaxID=3366810 RepID=UPI00372D40B1
MINEADATAARPEQANDPRPRRGLFAVRSAALALSGLITLLFLYKIPSYFLYIRETCPSTACEYAVLTPLPPAVLEEIRWTYGDLAALNASVALLHFAVFFVGALLIFVKRPNDPFSYIAGAAFIAFSASHYIPIMWRELGWLSVGIENTSSLLFVLFLLLFPNGKIVRRWMFATGIGLALLRMVAHVFRDEPWGLNHWPIAVNLAWMVLLYGTVLCNQYVRYRYEASAIERQQTKWFLYGLMLSLTGILIVSVIPLLFRPDFFSEPDPVWLLVLDILVILLMLPIPATLTMTMLRKRLWDIDPIMNRTLVYAGLSALIIAVYSLTVWYLSYLFQVGQNMALSLFATGVTAFLFAPLKERLQKAVNRMMYGEQHDPYTVLLELGNRLKEPLAPFAALETVAKTVKEALRLPYAGIKLVRHDQPLLVASVGDPPPETTTFPLVSGGQEIGSLIVAVRSPGETFNEADRRMLGILSRQASSVLQSVKQTMDIGLLIDELQHSREQLIMAREEERRSMRNNLHDEIAPRLASMKLTASLVEDWIREDPPKAIAFMDRFKTEIGKTVEEIRGIVYDLRPPALDELGLVGAVRQRAEQLLDVQAVQAVADVKPLRIDIEPTEPLPILPAAIEVGAYRIVTEALVNVVKHSRADSCRVRIEFRAEANELRIEIADNGIGLKEQASKPKNADGVGLTSIRERTAELGGACRFDSPPEGGTTISASLPIKVRSWEGETDGNATSNFGGG